MAVPPVAAELTFKDVGVFKTLVKERLSVRVGKFTVHLPKNLPTSMPRNSPYRVLVTGAPGTGKSYAVKIWAEQSRGRCGWNVFNNGEYDAADVLFELKAPDTSVWDTAMCLFGADIMYATTNLPWHSVEGAAPLFDEIWEARSIGNWALLKGSPERAHVVPKDTRASAAAAAAANPNAETDVKVGGKRAAVNYKAIGGPAAKKQRVVKKKKKIEMKKSKLSAITSEAKHGHAKDPRPLSGDGSGSDRDSSPGRGEYAADPDWVPAHEQDSSDDA